MERKNYKAKQARIKILKIMEKEKKMKIGDLAIAIDRGRKQTHDYVKDLSESSTPITYYQGIVMYVNLHS